MAAKSESQRRNRMVASARSHAKTQSRQVAKGEWLPSVLGVFEALRLGDKHRGRVPLILPLRYNPLGEPLSPFLHSVSIGASH
jgi:hypothetical protein